MFLTERPMIMKKEKRLSNKSKQQEHHEIPDIEIIDLDTVEEEAFVKEDDKIQEKEAFAEEESEIQEETFAEEENEIQEEAFAEEEDEIQEDDTFEEAPKRKGFHFYMHFALLATVIAVIGITAYRVTHWGSFISQEEIFEDGEGVYVDNYDSIFPVEDEEGNILLPDHDGNGLSILVLGNAPFADDTDSEDSLAAMVEELTGGTVINCAVSGSYMAAQWPYLSPKDAPMDVYTPYWLCALAILDDKDLDRHYENAAEILGEERPPEADYVFETFSNIDLNTIDVVTFMYDASDYLMGHPMYSDENPTDVEQFTGNMEAAISILRENYPHLRIIVMSPTYAFAIDDNGEYISSDVKRYGWDVLSTYVIRQCFSCNSRGVTFVDNLYGTITEDNAAEYLTDNLHLNVEGRRLVAERFLYALNYFGS